MSLTVNIDISGALRKFDIAKDQIPFATALALTRTAQAVKRDLQDGMRAAFQNPRKFTINSLSVAKATKQNLCARVFVKSKSVEAALKPEIFGGGRDKAVEKFLSGVMPSGLYAVPTSNAKRGADGKVSISWLRQIVQKLGYTGNVSAGKQRRRRMSSTTAAFILLEPHGRLKPGIYGRDGRQAIPLILFTSQPQYSARFDFFGIGERSARAHFETEFRKAAEQAMRTAR